jgi:transposase-like protein
MSIGNHRDPTKEQFWRRMLGQCQRSGLSVRAFCQEHDLSEASFYAWRRTRADRDAPTPAFVPVEIVPEMPSLAPSNSADGGLELLLGGRESRTGLC